MLSVNVQMARVFVQKAFVAKPAKKKVNFDYKLFYLQKIFSLSRRKLWIELRQNMRL